MNPYEDKGKLHINLAKDIKGVETVEVTNNITVGEGDNITNITGDKITLGDTIIEGDKVTVGDTIINNEGLTINNGPTFTKTEVNVGGNKITNVYEGDSDTDAVNLSQVKRMAAVGSDNRNVGVYKDKDEKQTIVSPYLQVEGVGDASTAKQNVEIVDSYAAKKAALEEQKTKLDPDDKDAIAKIDGKLQALEEAYTAAKAKIEADREILKAFAQATGSDSIAIGSGSKAVADYSVAIGKGAVVMNAGEDGIALGSGSVASTGKGVIGDNPLNVTADFTSPAWTSTAGAVSVGDVKYDEKGNVTSDSITRQITGVAAGKRPTDAVNVAQLKLVNAAASAHTTVTVDGSEIGKNVTEGNLLLTVTEEEGKGTNFDLKLSDNITIGGQGKDGADGKDGHIGVDGADGKSGVGIDGKDGITVYGKDGKDGDPAVAINGKDGVGTIGLAGRDGTNGKDGTSVVDIQVGPGGEPGLDGKDGITRIIYEDKDGEHEVATLDDGLKFGGDMGDPSQVKLNKQVNIVGGVTDESKLTDGNIGVVSSQDGENGKLEIKLSKDLKDLETIEVTKNITVGDNITIDGDNTNITVGDTTINNDGLTINGGPTITKTEVNVAGNRITNVAIGVDATDAVNMSQLTEVKNIASAHNTVTVDGSEIGKDVTEGNLLLTVTQNEAGGDNYDLKLSDNITIGGQGKDGVDGKDGHIGVDGADGKSGVGIDGKDGITVYGKDGKDGDPAVAINGKDGVGTIGLAGRDGTNGKDGTSVVDIQVGPGGEPGLDGKDGITRIIYEDKDGEHEVATLDDGMKYGGDFGEVSQVKLNKQVNIVGGAASEADLTDGNIGVVSSQDGENGKLEIKLNKDLQNIETVQVNKNITVGDNITIDGDTTNITVGDTVIDNSSVTTNEVKAGDTVINEGGITTNNIETKNINVTENITYKGDPIVTDVTYEYDSNTLYVNKGDTVNEYVLKGTVYEGDNKTINISEDNVISVIEGNVAEGDKGVVTGDTIYNEVRVHQDGNYIKQEYTTAENLTALDERVYNNTTNIENLGNAINNTNNQVGRLDNRMRKGLAGSAALAALHPMDFDPDDKLQFSAGVGNYRGETAAALGMFYRPDESVMFSLGGTVGNGENMVNAGITFALDGKKNRITRGRTAMAKEIIELRSLVTQMAARMDRMDAAAGIETAMFPDVPENHWAYEYVEDLQKRGALEGYPDGLFKGDRTMTRYEFAAMLDRLVRKGITLDSKIAKEFEPELGRIYVERISGQDNDRNKIERVRVNNQDKETRDVYGSKIVSKVPTKAAAK
ncbi:MAG: YadA-like family protein [Acidaminococcaceae bacterium]|nr:YadA-like family protein [Acidaminococcaceae bacterium]